MRAIFIASVCLVTLQPAAAQDAVPFRADHVLLVSGEVLPGAARFTLSGGLASIQIAADTVVDLRNVDRFRRYGRDYVVLAEMTRDGQHRMRPRVLKLRSTGRVDAYATVKEYDGVEITSRYSHFGLSRDDIRPVSLRNLRSTIHEHPEAEWHLRKASAYNTFSKGLIIAGVAVAGYGVERSMRGGTMEIKFNPLALLGLGISVSSLLPRSFHEARLNMAIDAYNRN